jgi:endonuclease-3 related protein
MDSKTILAILFQRLLEVYGPRHWWPARTRFEVIVGAILTQNVSWKNAKVAVYKLKKSGLLSPSSLLSVSPVEIAINIKSSRFYNQKAQKLINFCNYLKDKHNLSLNKMFSNEVGVLRKELLKIKGIGKETADSILLYAGNKLSFVVDAYTKRFLFRYGLLGEMSSYDEIRMFFMSNVPMSLYIYKEFHALIVQHCYSICKLVPDCSSCEIKNADNNILCTFYSKQ